MINIRKIRPEDYDETSDMIASTMRISYKDIYPDELIEEFCEKYQSERLWEKANDIELLVAEKNQEIVGIIGLKENQLRSFYVRPDQQGQGLGRQLYNKLEEIVIKRGLDKIILESNIAHSQKVYEHFGFKTVGTLEKERSGHIYRLAKMEKQL